MCGHHWKRVDPRLRAGGDDLAALLPVLAEIEDGEPERVQRAVYVDLNLARVGLFNLVQHSRQAGPALPDTRVGKHHVDSAPFGLCLFKYLDLVIPTGHIASNEDSIVSQGGRCFAACSFVPVGNGDLVAARNQHLGDGQADPRCTAGYDCNGHVGDGCSKFCLWGFRSKDFHRCMILVSLRPGGVNGLSR